MKKISILLADDHAITRMGLNMLIANKPDMTVVGEAEDGEEAIRLARELRPDIVILDLMMPGISGATATKAIRSENTAIRIVILTTFGDPDDLALAVKNGANATLLKDTRTDDIIDALRKVAAGEEIIPQSIRNMKDEDDSLTTLTNRQKEVLHSVSRGLTNADIAKQLGITEIGVQKHLKLIFTKLGAANRTEAAAIALRKHLLKI